ncbi:hypothetical protein BED46_007220 [Burkholderia contaminans]|uniref:Uncharacterized protein n=1 Tax=Burkholderia contaminans LMG 23361 TaxID=1334628 RepID=A0ABD4AMG4_9BURK|nr:hypothetical protein WR31_36305 [Burkholderia contaminans LMG 23361]MBA9827749.1 hypothetical protein [Burkholderia contaminans]MBA9836240.1 hypothetical protein [Burkholderia contaminans]MBA9860745.1 hypothetical protein [Burkholderia contaminans]MBA9903193.1 hypothetical protein [Burkholderia contaminans]
MAFGWHFRVFVACAADVVAFIGTDDSPGLDRSSSKQIIAPAVVMAFLVERDLPASAVARAPHLRRGG